MICARLNPDGTLSDFSYREPGDGDVVVEAMPSDLKTYRAGAAKPDGSIALVVAEAATIVGPTLEERVSALEARLAAAGIK